MLNVQTRCFKSKRVIKKAEQHKKMISPIVVLEKLPMKLFTPRETMIFNTLNHSENKFRQRNNKNNFRYKKRKRRFTKLKKKPKETISYLNSDNILNICIDNSSSKKNDNKIGIKNVNKSNLCVNSHSNNIPMVVLERIMDKKELNMYSDNTINFPIKNEKLDDETNVGSKHESTNEETDINEMPVQENGSIKSALTESEQMCIKTENEIESMNNYLEHSITDVDINDCDIELYSKIEKTDVFNETELNQNYETTLENMLENSENTEEIVENANSVNVIKLDGNKHTYLWIQVATEDILRETCETNTVYEIAELNVIDENVLNQVETEESQKEILSLEEVCQQMDNNTNAEVIDTWTVDESSLSPNSKVQIETNNTQVNCNKNISFISSKLVPDVPNEVNTKLFILKCLKCNITKLQYKSRYLVKCEICDSILYHECLICKNQYKSIYTMYSHLSRKHQIEKTAANHLKKNNPVQQLQDGENETSYLRMEEYHKKRNDAIFRTVSDPISAYCTSCSKYILATEKTETWCIACMKKYIFFCNKCNYVRKNYGQVRLHVLRQHAEKILHCPNKCDSHFSYSQTHWKHIKSCNKYQSKDSEINISKVVSLPQCKSYCYKCGQYFDDKPSMMEHVHTCNRSLNLLICEHCVFKTDSQNLLDNHLKKKHAL